MERFKSSPEKEHYPEHLDDERLKTIAHYWIQLLRIKGIAPEQILKKEKEWPKIEEYTYEEVKGLFRGDPIEDKKFWREFKKDYKHISKCDECGWRFELFFWSQFR